MNSDPRLNAAFENRNLVFVAGTGVAAASTHNAPFATWKGLLEDGIAHAVRLGAQDQWGELMKQNCEYGFANGDLALVTSAADAIKENFQARGDTVYANWLRETVGSLKTVDEGVAESLRRLPFPLLTTNYDTLLESHDRPTAAWTDSSSMLKLLGGGSRNIGHLHGVWSEPDSVVFSRTDYERLLASEPGQAIQSAMSSLKSVVYVGFGSGLEDSNFRRLIDWHARLFGISGPDHFRLCLASELDGLRMQHSNDHIIPIAYGTSHTELASFLSRFVSSEIEVSEAGIAKDVVALAQRGLLDELKRDSIIGETLDDIDGCRLEDVILPPILLPVPQADYVRSRVSKDPTARVERLTAEEEVRGADIVILAAEENSGLTTAMKWLALEAAKYLAVAAPIYVSFRKCRRAPKPLAEQVLLAAQSSGLISGRQDPLPPYVLALDDFSPYVDHVSGRVITELAANPAIFTVIGCAAGVEDELVDRLGQAGVKARVRYLGKLASADVRALARLASPTNYEQLTRQVLKIVSSEHLPRTPFTIALLLSLYLRGGAVSANASQTSILDDYVGALLGRGDPHDDARFGLDQSQREAVLAGLAQAFVESRVGGMREADVVTVFQAQFDRFAWDESPTAVLKSFLDRRVLRHEGQYVTFARSSILHLFAAKRATVDPTFRDRLIANPMFHSADLADYAALFRHDADLLRQLSSLLVDDRWESERGTQFERVRHTGLLRLAPMNDAEGPQGEGAMHAEAEDSFDYSTDEDAPPYPIMNEDDLPPGLQLIRLLDLVSRVLRDSDQIEDLGLKGAAVVETMKHWGIVMSVLNRDRSFKEFLRQIFEELQPDEADPERREELLEELTKAMPASIAMTGIGLTLASRKLLVLVQKGISDGSLAAVEETVVATAFFLLALKEPGWVDQMALLLGDKKDIWIVRNFLLHLLLEHYYRKAGPKERQEEDALLTLCLDIAQASTSYTSEHQKVTHRDQLREDFKGRQIAHRMRTLSQGESEPEDS